MDILNKITRIFLTIILILCMILLFLSFHVQEMFSSLINEAMKSQVSTKITTILNEQKVFNKDLPNEEINHILLNDQELEVWQEKYINQIIQDVITQNTNNKISLVNDLIKMLENHQEELETKLNIKITDEQLKQLEDKLIESEVVENYYQSIVKQANRKLTAQEKTLLKYYHRLQSTSTQWILFSIILGSTILLALLHKSFYKWLFNVGVASILSSGLLLILLPIIKSVIDYYFQEQLNILEEVKMNNTILHTIWILGIGIVLLVLYYTINYFTNKKRTMKLSE